MSDQVVLPTEIMYHIISYLDYETLNNISNDTIESKQSSEYVWKKYIKNRYPNIPNERLKKMQYGTRILATGLYYLEKLRNFYLYYIPQSIPEYIMKSMILCYYLTKIYLL
jgi:hypothetical protein